MKKNTLLIEFISSNFEKYNILNLNLLTYTGDLKELGKNTEYTFIFTENERFFFQILQEFIKFGNQLKWKANENTTFRILKTLKFYLINIYSLQL